MANILCEGEISVRLLSIVTEIIIASSPFLHFLCKLMEQIRLDYSEPRRKRWANSTQRISVGGGGEEKYYGARLV